jgi:hypothetical protein
VEACCFHTGECLDLPFNDCLLNGGLPMGLETTCGEPGGENPGGIGECSFQACCWRQRPDDPYVCDDLTPQMCRDSVRGEPMGRGLLCRWIAAAGGCGIEFIDFPCCLVDGTRIYTQWQYCEAVRGTLVSEDEPCPPPAVDEDCRFPERDRIVGPAWTLELCANAVLTPRLAFEQTYHRDGYGMLVTERGIRNTPTAECEQAATTLFLDDGLYGEAVMCSRQWRFLNQWRGHEGVLVLQPAEGPQFTRPGYGVHLSAYDAPDWSETTLGSVRLRCWGPYE